MSARPFLSRPRYTTYLAMLLVLGSANLAFSQKSGTVAVEDEDENAAQAQPRFRRPILIDTIKWEPKEGSAVTLVYSNALRVTEPDYANLAKAQPGDIVPLTTCAAPKFRTDFHLLFGETRIERDNVAKNYPGVYSLWLKKTTEGWDLVFNWKADVWGTMHDPSADVAEIPLEYTFKEDEAKAVTTLLRSKRKSKDVPRFRARLDEEDGQVHFAMEWGPHHWSTHFKTA